MEIVNWSIDILLMLVHVIFSVAPPLVGLTYLAAAVGAAMLWVFGRTSNQKRMKQVKRRVQAGLLELRVFVDEPAIALRAQKGLVAANLNYLALALRPALWMFAPLGLLLIHLEAFYERAPLPLAQPALPVRAAAAREISWRVVPMFPGSENLVFRFRGRKATKCLEAGGSQRYVPGRSVRSLWGTILFPGEGRLHSDFAEWIEVRYPDSALQLFGFRVHWLVWFLVVSMASALLLKKRFGVVI